ncbi:hypothetical protein EV182_005845, partial [Spiromyces aspiralis]
MSLRRLPQVAFRRLVPAITTAPNALDDQFKQYLEANGHSNLKKALEAAQSKSSESSPSIISLLGTLGRVPTPQLSFLTSTTATGDRMYATQEMAISNSLDPVAINAITSPSNKI